MEQNLKRNVLEFLTAVKRATAEGAFADPQKLNEIIPMTVVWRDREKKANLDTWLFASSIALRNGLFPSDQISYRIRANHMWAFSVYRVNQAACVEFDELVAALGTEYLLATKLHRRSIPGSEAPRIGLRKNAGERVIFSANVSSDKGRISARIGLDGCVESVESGQIIESKSN